MTRATEYAKLLEICPDNALGMAAAAELRRLDRVERAAKAFLKSKRPFPVISSMVELESALKEKT